MCTLSWIRERGGYQLFFNRDELLSRKPALTPTLGRNGAVSFIAPRDGDFGGNWIAVNRFGVSLCLLNGYHPADRSQAVEFTSRGLLVASLTDRPSLADVERALGQTELERFRSFRLAVFEPAREGALLRWEDRRLSSVSLSRDWLPLVSSSFANEEVRRNRIAQFGEMRRKWDGTATELHLAYHASHLPQSGPYSTCMHRSDGETVSFSRVEVDARSVRFHYSPHSPCRGRPAGPPVVLDR